MYEKKRGREGAFQTEEELTQQDRKRKRRTRKTEKRKEKRREQQEERLVAKLNPGLGNKYEKEKVPRCPFLRRLLCKYRSWRY